MIRILKKKIDDEIAKNIVAITGLLLVLAMYGVTFYLKGDSIVRAAFDDDSAPAYSQNVNTNPNNDEENNTGIGKNDNVLGNPEEEQNEQEDITDSPSAGNSNIIYQETILERIEEIEKQISEDMLLNWTSTNMNVSYTTTSLGIYKQEMKILKTAITSDSNNAVCADEPIVYLLQIKNNGNEDVTGINISDEVPAKTTLIEEKIYGGGVYDKNTNKIRWKVDIKAGETVSVRYAVVVNKNVTGTIKNTAIINGTETNEVSNPIIKTSKTSGVYRDGKLVKTGIANVGDQIKYTIKVQNTGDVPAVANVKDTIPANTKLVSDIVLAGKIISKSAMIDGKNITIPAGKTETLTFTVEVEKVDGSIKNTSKVDEEAPSNTVKTAHLEIAKTVSATGEEGTYGENIILSVGETAYFKIELKNTGSEKLEFDITDKINGKSVELFDGNQKIAGTVTIEQNETKVLTATYVMKQKDIDNQEILTNKVTVVEKNSKVQKLEETASIIPRVSEPSIYVEKKTTSVIENGLSEEKEITKNTKVRPGDTIIYTISVKNNGNVTLNSINVTDSLDVQYSGSLVKAGVAIEEIKSLAPNEEKVYKVEYEVTDTDLENGETITNSATVTNSATSAKTETDKQIPINPNTTLSGTKKWIDYNNQEKTRPDSIIIEVLNENEVVEEIEVTPDAQGEWKFTLNELPKYDEQSNEIQYTVREKQVPTGYIADYTDRTVSEDGNITANITNTLITAPTITVSGTKIWEDYNNQEETRPDSIIVEVLNGSKVVEEIKVTPDAEGKWKYTSKSLQKYGADNKPINYTVRESVNGYRTSNTEPVKDADGNITIDITNTLKDELTVTVSGTKTWVDYNDQENTRPDSIIVEVLNGSKVVEEIPVAPNAEGKWTYTSKALQKYDSENKVIQYVVKEKQVPKGYIADYTDRTVAEDGEITANITNTLIEVPTIIVSGTKTWIDYKNQEDTRPDSIIVEVLNGSKVVEEIEVTPDAEGKWKYTSKELVKYDSKNELINYTVRESTNGYRTSNTEPVKDADGNITIDITNTLKEVPTIDLTGELFWEDADNQDGIRPENVTISVISNDSTDLADRKVEIGKQNSKYDWTYEFEGLPKYDKNNKKIEYTVTVEGIDDNKYTTTPETPVTDEKTGNITADLTITHEPETITVSGTKHWANDNDNLNNTRPDSIVITLMSGSTKVKEAEITPDSDGNWKYSFEKLRKNADGKPINYTIKELTVVGYTSELEDKVTDAQGNITIDLTNTYIPPELTKVKTSSAGTTVKPNEKITYTLETENIGETLAKAVIITDVVPDFTTLDEDSISNGGVLGNDGKTITWNVGDLEAGEKATVTFDVTVNATVDAIGKNIVNTGKVNGDNTNTVASKVIQYVTTAKVVYPIQDVDIVLVLDVSGSMEDNSRLSRMKSAAKDFITGIFPEGANNTGSTVTVIKFSSSASKVGSKATNYSTAETLKRKIEDLDADGGTNIEAALSLANTVVDGLSNTNKFVLFLGDGAPTPKFVIAQGTYDKSKETYTESGSDYKNNTEANITSQATTLKGKTTGVYSIGFGVDSLLETREYWSHYIQCTKANCKDSNHITVNSGSTNYGKSYHWESAKSYATRVLRDIIADERVAATDTTREKVYYYEATDANASSIVSQFMTVLQEISIEVTSNLANTGTIKIPVTKQIDKTKEIKVTIDGTTTSYMISDLPQCGLSFTETAEEAYFTWDLTNYITAVLKLEYTVNLLDK